MENICLIGRTYQQMCYAGNAGRFYMFDKEYLLLWQVELLQVERKIKNFYSITDVSVHHKTRFVQDYSYGVCKDEDTLDFQKWEYKTIINEVVDEEDETFCCRNCTAKLFNQREPGEE